MNEPLPGFKIAAIPCNDSCYNNKTKSIQSSHNQSMPTLIYCT